MIPFGFLRRRWQIFFDTSSDNISLHLKNIFNEAELDENLTTEDFSVVRQEGKRQVTRKVKHYNLDAINFSRLSSEV